MKSRDLANLLNRAAAGLENSDDLQGSDMAYLIEDLTIEAREIANAHESLAPMPKALERPSEFFSVTYRGFHFTVRELGQEEERDYSTDRYRVVIPHKLKSITRTSRGTAMNAAIKALDEMLEGKDPEWR